MKDIVISFGLDGEDRAIYSDDLPLADLGGGTPRRASIVDPIQSGKNVGKWFVDMSPLGEDYRYCLFPPVATRAEALEEERRHLVERWICGGK